MSNDEAFTAWARQHSPLLLRRATLLCGDRQLAEDLVQETLVRVFLRWSRIDHDDNPVGYAHTILYRQFLAGRRRRSSTELPSSAPPERAVDVADDDLRLDLLASLQKLPPPQRCVVVARYLDDRPVAEVAAVMGRTEGWVRVNAQRALRRLRGSLTLLLSTPEPRSRRP